MGTLRLRITAMLCRYGVAVAMVAGGSTLSPAAPTALAQGGEHVIRVVPGGGAASSSSVAGLACGSEAFPCASIQQAIDLARPGDVIWIASGVYAGDGDATIHLSSGKSVSLIGGYNPVSGQLDAAAAEPTIIDGGGERRGVLINNVGGQVVLENLIIRNGRAAEGIFAWGAMGAGLLCLQNAAVVLRNVTFSNNEVYAPDTKTAGGGGAAFLWGGPGATCPATLENVRFENNRVYGGNGNPRGGQAHGGGLYATYSDITATNVTFVNNWVQAGSGGVGYRDQTWNRADGLGGGASFQNNRVTIRNLVATDNRVAAGDGSLYGGYADGGALFFELSTATVISATLRNNAVRGGKGSNGEGGVAGGGGLMAKRSRLTLDQMRLVDNSSRGGDGVRAGHAGGGAIYVSLCDAVTGSNLVLARNRTEAGQGSDRYGGGGGIFSQSSTLFLEHMTFEGNQTLSTMLGRALVALEDGRADLRYTIIANHVGEGSSREAVVAISGARIDMNATLFDANSGNVRADGGVINSVAARQGDPAFHSPGPPEYDYRIRLGSAAQDQAIGSSVAHDFEGRPRPYGVQPDIGAAEAYPALFDSDMSISGARIVRPDCGGLQPTPPTTFTVRLVNSGWLPLAAEVVNPLPSPPPPTTLHLMTPPTCDVGRCGYHPATSTVSWSGEVPARGSVMLVYALGIVQPCGETATAALVNEATLRYVDGNQPQTQRLTGLVLINGQQVFLPVVRRDR